MLYLLGDGEESRKTGVLAKWRPTSEMVTATINFAFSMGRVQNRREECEESDDSDTLMSNSSRVEKVGERLKVKSNPRKLSMTHHQQPNILRPSIIHVDIADV